MQKNPGRILAALDGSPPSENALKYAIFLASTLSAALVGVYVVEEEKIGYWRFIDEHFKKELRKKGQEVLERAREIAGEKGLDMETRILKGGAPYEELVRFIERNQDVSAVVLGDHGLRLTDRHILGSTTERVIREISKRGIPVAVTVVPYVAPDSPECRLYAGPLCT